jgi:predicted enzyme related to lactoylglutathione lyase
MKGAAFKPSGEGVQIYFYDADIDATLRRLDARGAKIVLSKTAIGPFGFIAVFEDSEGNHIGLRSWR